MPAFSRGTWPELRSALPLVVDKTVKLWDLVSTQRKAFLGRPRLMGKTLLCAMLEELFAHGDGAFAGMAIYGKWSQHERFPVIRLSLRAVSTNAAAFEASFKALLFKAYARAGLDVAGISLEQPLLLFLGKLSRLSRHQRLVFLLEDVDYPLAVNLGSRADWGAIQAQLKTFYAWLRNLDNVRYVLLTGTLRLRASSLLGGQDIQDISMVPYYADLLGYTQDEVETTFAPYLPAAAARLKLTEGELWQQLQRQYGGFCFDYEGASQLYSPLALNQFFAPAAASAPNAAGLPTFASYWLDSSQALAAVLTFVRARGIVPQDLQRFLQPVVLGQEAFTAPVQAEQVTLEQVLVQSGILSIKAVSAATQTLPPQRRRYECGLTNAEVATALTRAVAQVGLVHGHM